MKFGLVSTKPSSSSCTARSWRKRGTRRSLQVRRGRNSGSGAVWFSRVAGRSLRAVIPSKPPLRSEGSGRADSCRCTKGAHPQSNCTTTEFRSFLARDRRLRLAAFLRLQFAHFLAHFLTRFTKSMLPGLVSVAKGHGITSLRCYRICRDAGSSRGHKSRALARTGCNCFAYWAPGFMMLPLDSQGRSRVMSERKEPNVGKILRRNSLKWVVLVVVLGITVGWLFDTKWILGCILLALIVGLDLTIIRRAVLTMGEEEPLAVHVVSEGKPIRGAWGGSVSAGD